MFDLQTLNNKSLGMLQHQMERTHLGREKQTVADSVFMLNLSVRCHSYETIISFTIVLPSTLVTPPPAQPRPPCWPSWPPSPSPA